jgi:hypothetical protein
MADIIDLMLASQCRMSTSLVGWIDLNLHGDLPTLACR